MPRRVRRALGWGATAFVVAAAVGRLLLGPQILPTGPVEWIGFEEIRRSSTGNDALACPPATCQETEIESPTAEADLATLRSAVDQVVAAEPRWTTVLDDGDRILAVQRSLVFGFPDIVQIELRIGPDGGAGLLVFSRSVYGRSDLGVNRARVRRIVEGVATRLRQAGG